MLVFIAFIPIAIPLKNWLYGMPFFLQIIYVVKSTVVQKHFFIFLPDGRIVIEQRLSCMAHPIFRDSFTTNLY